MTTPSTAPRKEKPSNPAHKIRDPYMQNPRWWLFVGMGGLLGGIAGIVDSVNRSDAVTGLLSIAMLVLSLLALNDWLRTVVRQHYNRALLIGGGCLTIGVMALGAGIGVGDPVVSGLGVGLAVVGSLPIHLGVRLAARSNPLRWVFSGLVISAAGGALPTFGIPLLFGLLGVSGGIAVYKYGLSWWCTSPRSRPLAGGAAFAAVAGVVLCLAGIQWMSAPAFGFGACLVVFGLHAASVAWIALEHQPLGRRVVRLAGIVVTLTGTLVTWSSGIEAQTSALVGLLVAGVGGSIAWRGDGMVVLVGAAFVIVWVQTGTSARQGADPHPEADERIVVFGDSYISGEGAPEYFPGTNLLGSQENQCRRAPTAYPWLVANELDLGLDSFACSGAKTTNVVVTSDGGVPQMPNSDESTFGRELQIDNLPPLFRREENVVAAIVSIGGNDANFSEVARGCLLPGSCSELRELWLGNLELIGPRLRDTYRQLKASLPGVPIVVMPYPLMLTDEGCGWSLLDAREHLFLSEFVTVLNDQIRVAAAQEGVNFVSEAMFAFEGQRLCDGDGADGTVMNFIDISPTDGEFLDRLNPATWIHGSMHPKPSGHEETARVLTEWLRNHLAKVEEGSALANPAPVSDVRPEIRGLRNPEPVLIDTSRLELPESLACAVEIGAPGAVIDSFGSRTLVMDAPTRPSPPLLLADADPSAPMCVTSSVNGLWEVADQPVNGVVEIALERPRYVGANGRLEDTQSVLYRSTTGVWRVRLVSYCSLSARCVASASEWTDIQVAASGRAAAPVALLLFLGGWLFAVSANPQSFFRSWRFRADDELALERTNAKRSAS